MNKPWECPRCGRINAPFNPSCFCNRDDKKKEAESEKEFMELAKRVAKPLYTFKQVEDYMKNSHCLNCGGHHGIFNGRAVQCADLQNGFCHGLPIHKVTS